MSNPIERWAAFHALYPDADIDLPLPPLPAPSHEELTEAARRINVEAHEALKQRRSEELADSDTLGCGL